MDQHVTKKASLDRSRLVEFVRKWAEVNTDGILDKTTQIFAVDHIEGLVGYRIKLGNAVVYGDPVCAPENKIALAREFEAYCKKQKIGVMYIIVSEEFANSAAEHLSFSLIEFGRKFVLDPTNYLNPKTPLLRKKVRQSSNKGVEIHEYTGYDPQIEQGIEDVARAWTEARKGIQIYLAEPTLFADREGKRWFYAKSEKGILGFVLLNKLQSQEGWLLNNVMYIQEAPSGVSEHLAVFALQTLEKEQCRLVLIGPVPSKDLGRIVGLGQFITLLAKWTFKSIRKLCHLDGHEIFWDKFQPELRSSYLLFPKKRLRPSTILALLRALNLSLR